MICEGHRDGNMEWANRASPERRAWIPAAILGADFLDLFHFVLGAICVLGEIRARTHTNTIVRTQTHHTYARPRVYM